MKVKSVPAELPRYYRALKLTKLEISLSSLLQDKDLCTNLVQSQQRAEKGNEKPLPLPYVHVWEKEREAIESPVQSQLGC